MNFDLPRGVIFPVDHVDISLVAGPHPFGEGRAAEIAANWRKEKAGKPALFDGEVALLSSLKWSDGRLAGTAHLVRYSLFMYWRRLRPSPIAEHCYAHAIPVSSDGALIAIRMSDGTVGAGQAYFAAGSFEADDFSGGKVDVAANMVREVAEETGLDLVGLPVDARHHALSLPQGTVIFRRVLLPFPADEAVQRIEAFVRERRDPEQEITGPVVIRNATDLPDNLAPQMPALIDWHFAAPSLVP